MRPTSRRLASPAPACASSSARSVKVGMDPGTKTGCRTHGALHRVFPTGNTVIAATAVEEVEDTQ